ncbi:nuclear factor related to kappa-B-binding protein-like isoform X3 [Eriocheir sinensis]|uniref:nuclear factor related to kappa-B-binding protein-like isoform X3 n=1 Tax=Eriocheir sinensis TaxID=95602 RepID=UPI0021CA6A2A|nr:nuclear factor related to kappa-B-binding protein-like isoform X3 [Eriocheir sinensis]
MAAGGEESQWRQFPFFEGGDGGVWRGASSPAPRGTCHPGTPPAHQQTPHFPPQDARYPVMEKIVYAGVSLEIPSEICENINILFEMISPDTWNNQLTDEHRERLMGFLPTFPENDLQEKTRTLEMFFMDENFRHSTPLRLFHEQLCKGFFNPEIAKVRTIHKKMLLREYRYRQKQYLHHTLEEILVRRKRVLDIVSSMPPDDVPKIPRLPPLQYNKKKSSRTSIEYCTKKRYFRELAAIRAEVGDTSDLSEDEIYPEGPGASLNKKQRRQLGGLEGSLPPDLLPVRATHSSGSLALDLELRITPTNNPLDLTDDHFRAMLSAHRIRRSKRENSVDLDTRGITLQDIITRAQIQMKRPPQRTSTASPLPPERPKKKIKVKKEPPSSSSSSPSSSLLLSSSNIAAHHHHSPHHLELATAVVKAEVVSDTESSSSSSSSSSVSDSEETEVKKELPSLPHSPAVKGRVGGKGIRVKLEPPELPLEEMEVGNLPGVDQPLPVKEENFKVEVKEEYMEDQVSAAAIETSSELTAALESIGACIAPELTQETHICFFSLVRDIICSTGEQRMTRAQLESSIRVWQESAISPLNEWYSLVPSWVDILPSAINFLCGHFTDVQPADFVPYIEYKSQLKVYQWIGAGRDSDGHLEPLAQFWLANKSSMSCEWIEDDLVGTKLEVEESDVIPPPRCFTNWTVQAATDAEKDQYRVQEKLRYEKPHKAFTFRMHGYESVVGPVKGIYTQQTGLNKARGHSLLVPDRPAYVTILSLVRDAVARLPNGEGTRSDICELLKESQYLAPLSSPTAENNLNSVVSGALDRLHYEHDPCVKYDTPRKLWIYLHRNRNEEEFERMHHLNGPGGNKVKKPAPRRQSRTKSKEPPLTLKPAPNVALEPLSATASPVAKTESGPVKLKPEDVAVLTKPKPESPVRLEHHLGSAAAVGKALTSVRVGGVRGTVGASSVQTIQVSTTGGVQTIKVALPPGAQTLTKVNPQTLAKAVSRAASQGLAKGAAAGLKGVNLQQTVLQAGVAGQSLGPESVLTTQHLTTLPAGAVGAGKTRAPVVTLTTREAARLPAPSVAQARPAQSSAATTSPANQQQQPQPSPQHPGLTPTLATQVTSSGVAVGKLSNTATVVNMSSAAAQKSNLFSIGGIKLLQAAPQQLTGKAGSTSPAMVNSITKLQTLMVDGKVLMQGGKNESYLALQVGQALAGNVTVAGSMAGKQVITGVFPGQQIATVESLLSQSEKTTQIQAGGVITTMAGSKLAGGNVIQLAGGAGGVQRLTLVSPQGSHVPLTAANQRLVLATGSQGGKLDGSGNKAQVVQTIQTLQPASHMMHSGASVATTTAGITSTTITTTTTSSSTTTTQIVASPIASTATTSQARFFSVGQQQKTIVQGLNVTGKPSVLSAGGIRLVQPAVSGGGGTTTTGNLITIGGKQVLLTSKPFAQQGQLQQVMLTSGSLKGGLQGAQGSPGAGPGAVVVASGAGGQQIVLPASALQGSQLNLKGLQAFHTLKVIPASQVTQQQRGKPVLARIVSPASVRGAVPVTTTTSVIPNTAPSGHDPNKS